MLRIGALRWVALCPHIAVSNVLLSLNRKTPDLVWSRVFLVKIIQLELMQPLLPVLQPSASCAQGSVSELQRTDAPTLRAVPHILASTPVNQDQNLLDR